MKSKELSQQDIDYLLGLEKTVIIKGTRSIYEEINFNTQSSYRFNMALKEDLTDTVKFFLQIRRSDKNVIQITLHTQEITQNTCLIRIDLNPGAPHTNPPVAEGTVVPEFLVKYADKQISGSHIHYNIDGYKTAAWAIPIEDSDFPVKSFDEEDYVSCFNQIMHGFKKKINLETSIIHQNVILI